MKRCILSVLVGIAISVVPGHAHHSIAAAYDTRQEITIEGVVTQFQFINPHPFVMMDVKNGSATVSWMLELDNRYELVEVGMTSSTLKQGDRIVVTGSPATSGHHSLYTKRLDRPADKLLGSPFTRNM